MSLEIPRIEYFHLGKLEYVQKVSQLPVSFRSLQFSYRWDLPEAHYKSVKSEFGFNSSVSGFSKKFAIALKKGKKFKARLVKVSKDHDLALRFIQIY